MDLFEHGRKAQIEKESPLANRMRPRTLDEYVGQSHIMGPGRLLRRAIQADQRTQSSGVSSDVRCRVRTRRAWPTW